MTFFTLFWFFVLGSAIGSFLNVVIYRLPLGMSLGYPPSRCPKCGTAIKPRHNIPILGWLVLGGKCASCKAPISARYPLVEMTVGGLFLLLMLVEVITAGANLPGGPFHPVQGVAGTIWELKWDLFGIFLFHAFLLCVLLSASLMAWDGHAFPNSLLIFSSLLGILFPTLWPDLHPVLFWEPVPEMVKPWSVFWGWQGWFLGTFQSVGIGLSGVGALTSLSGWLGGMLLGGAVTWGNRSADSVDHALWKGLAVTGAFLGWQAVVSVALLALPAVLLLRCGLSRLAPWWRKPPLAGYLALATLFHILFWKQLIQLSWWPSQTSSPLAWAIFGCLFIGLVGLIRGTAPVALPPAPPVGETLPQPSEEPAL